LNRARLRLQTKGRGKLKSSKLAHRRPFILNVHTHARGIISSATDARRQQCKNRARHRKSGVRWLARANAAGDIKLLTTPVFLAITRELGFYLRCKKELQLGTLFKKISGAALCPALDPF
jgi:hypothetical protein